MDRAGRLPRLNKLTGAQAQKQYNLIYLACGTIECVRPCADGTAKPPRREEKKMGPTSRCFDKAAGTKKNLEASCRLEFNSMRRRRGWFIGRTAESETKGCSAVAHMGTHTIQKRREEKKIQKKLKEKKKEKERKKAGMHVATPASSGGPVERHRCRAPPPPHRVLGASHSKYG